MRSLPALIYGTAWKKDRTAELVATALRLGFRAIDTACQPKHYNEAGVGEGLDRFYSESGLTRDDLFIQTKFTSVNGQDPTKYVYLFLSPPLISFTTASPMMTKHHWLTRYSPHAVMQHAVICVNQVMQSFERSCSNLRTGYLDSLLLHSPMSRFEDTMTVWRVFETLHRSGRVRSIGISNVYDMTTLEHLYEQADVKPAYVQNRFYAKSGYDKEIRAFCQMHNMQYQSFWSLTANRHVMDR